MLCCLIGGGLVAWLARSARRNGDRPHNPLLALTFGLGSGMLIVALLITVLVPLGVVHATGPPAARVALLVGPSVAALLAARAGAAGSLLKRAGTTSVTAGAAAGALLAEEADLHLFQLHSAPGILAGLAVHLPGFIFLVGGLAWRARLPVEAHADDGCGCDRSMADQAS